MGYLLKEALKTLCGVSQWSYSIFWKIGCQNPKLLIWEECYHEPVPCSSLPRICGIESPELAFDDWEACWDSAKARALAPGVQAEDKVQALINKMMTSNQVNVIGEGLVGRAAFTGNHQWILSDNYAREAHPPEVLNELCQQISAGMQTIAVIPVPNHGVIQLGSSFAILENRGFVNDVKKLILQLGSVPGALLSEIQASPKIGVPVGIREHLSADLSDNSKNATSTFQTAELCQSSFKSSDELCERKLSSVINPYLSSRSQLETGVAGARVIPSNPEPWLSSGTMVGPSFANYSSCKSLEEQILSHASLQENANSSVGASNGCRMAHLKARADVIDSSHKVSVSNPILDETQLLKGMTNNSRLVSNPHSLPNAHKRAVSTSDMVNHMTIDHLLSGNTSHGHHRTSDQLSMQTDLIRKRENIDNDLFQSLNIPGTHVDMSSSEHNSGSLTDARQHGYGNQSSKSGSVKCADAFVQPPSGDDLFDIFGVDFKNKLFSGSWDYTINNEPGFNGEHFAKNNSTGKNIQGTGSDLYSVNEETSASGIFSATDSDHLLDAVVSMVRSASKHSSDDNVSCRTAVTNMSSSSAPNYSPAYGMNRAPNQITGDPFGLSKALTKEGVVGGPCSFRSECSKEETGNYSQTSSIYGSQISSWVEQGRNMKQNCSVSTGYSKKPDEGSKTNRKRLKPGENPRPRPKDRQMIQDRVKELREIVPNGAKCSIDALLERTIKHMLFLQSVTKHADKLKQTGESKINSKDGGLLLKDNFEGGATWAYEVGSQSMVCPIIVEDLNPPRQMLVEMLCEERGLFLEIADIIRGLGLTILKGVMETRNDKIWARFAVEANRDVTRMEIFLSLVRLLEQTIKSSAAPVNGLDNDTMMLHQSSFHQATSIPATGRPFNMQ